MLSNVGGLDRFLRMAVGVAMVVATAKGLLPEWGYVGLVPFITGSIGWCPAYVPLGISTCGGGCKSGHKG